MLFKKTNVKKTEPETPSVKFDLPEEESPSPIIGKDDSEEITANKFLNPLAAPDESIEINDSDEEDYDYGQNRNKFIIPENDFGPFLPYIKDPDVTDVDYNGQDLWVTDVHNRKIKAKTDTPITQTFIERFVRSVANAKSFDFNQRHPVMEAETKDLRISVVHKSRAVSGTSICIRKTPPFKRITERSSIETNYATREIVSFLANCIKAHMNIIVAGQPRAGKTELAKFLGCYIPDSERVITIEDVMEWRFKQLKPKADCIEIQTDDVFTYTDAIIASLKQNPNWIMIAETRGEEVASLINGFSTGVNGITTLHTDDVRKIPQRMLNMVNETNVEKRMLSNIYEFVDVGLLVAIRKNEETGERYRVIDQLGLFTCENGVMDCHMIVENGKIVSREFPYEIVHKFAVAGIRDNYFQNDQTDERLKQQGYVIPDEEKKSVQPEYHEPEHFKAGRELVKDEKVSEKPLSETENTSSSQMMTKDLNEETTQGEQPVHDPPVSHRRKYRPVQADPIVTVEN